MNHGHSPAIINGSSKVWLARVADQGRRRAKVYRTREEARHVEGALLQGLKAEAAREDREGGPAGDPAPLLEVYVDDLAAPGNGQDTISRAVETKTSAVDAQITCHRSWPWSGLRRLIPSAWTTDIKDAEEEADSLHAQPATPTFLPNAQVISVVPRPLCGPPAEES